MTLLDPLHDARFRSDGFVTAPFLDASERRDLEASYWEIVAGDDDHGQTIDYMRADRASMAAIRDLVEPVLDRHLDGLLVDHRLVLATFVVKHPGGGSAMYLHDDRSYVDERAFRSASLWIPFVDVGPATGNGTLEVVPGSHRLARGPSGSHTPDLIRFHEDDLRAALRPLTVAAGDAVVYDTRLLHASDENRTDRPRVALVCAVAPADAPLIHVVGTGRRRRVVHRVDADFFVRHHPREIEVAIPDRYPVVATFDDDPALDQDVLAELIGPTAAASPHPVVPPDLTPDGFTGAWAPFAERPAARVADDDARVGPGDLPHRPGDLAPDIAERSPAATVCTMSGHGQDPEVDHRLQVFRACVPPEAPAAWAVVLGPGARMTIAPSAHRGTLTVVDCPASGAGVAAGGYSSPPRPGMRLDLGAVSTEALRLWNDGPGHFALVLADGIEAPAAAGPPRRLRPDRLLGRWRRARTVA